MLLNIEGKTMTLDDIQDEWKKDSRINETDIASETLKIPELHSKYLRIYSQEYQNLVKMRAAHKLSEKLKIEYYSGELDRETLMEKGWEPFPKKVLKSDLSLYLDSDKDLIRENLKISDQKLKVELLESIIKSINTRGYTIKNYIDYMRFTSGN